MNVKPVYDPEEERKLTALNKEIAALMKKHDVCGYCVLNGKNTANYVMQLEASWSCITLKPQPDGSAQVRLKAAPVTGENPDMERRRLNYTMGMLLGTFDQLNAGADRIGHLISVFGPKVGPIDHVSVPFVPPRTDGENDTAAQYPTPRHPNDPFHPGSGNYGG